MSVILSIPKLAVKEKSFSERNKEIYVVSFTADLNPDRSNKTATITAANNETICNDESLSKLTSVDAFKYLTIMVSNCFERITPDNPVSLSGSGILLYPNLEPKGLLANHTIIMESDHGARKVGHFLEELLQERSVKTAVQALTASASVSNPLVGALLGAIVRSVPTVLKKSKDDLLLAHSHSGFDFDDYGMLPGQEYTDYPLENDMISATLRVRVRDN